MTRSELIARLYELNPSYTLEDIEEIAGSIIEQMVSHLAAGGRIELRGFGSFCLRYYKPKIGRNPKTGESVKLGGRYAPYFRPGKELKNRVNNCL